MIFRRYAKSVGCAGLFWFLEACVFSTIRARCFSTRFRPRHASAAFPLDADRWILAEKLAFWTCHSQTSLDPNAAPIGAR